MTANGLWFEADGRVWELSMELDVIGFDDCEDLEPERCYRLEAFHQPTGDWACFETFCGGGWDKLARVVFALRREIEDRGWEVIDETDDHSQPA